jgi:HEAT repeat protein
MRGAALVSWMGIALISVMNSLPAASEERHENDSIIQSMQQQALPDLIQSLTEKKKTRHLRVLRVSGDVEDQRASQYLTNAYEETTSEGVRCKLLESIGRLRDPSLIDWLAKRLKDSHISIQCFAIWALGELKSPQAAGFVRQKLWDPNRYIQMTAIDALGKSGKDQAIAAELGTFLRDEDVQVRYLAAKALIGVAGEDSAPELAQRLTEEPSLDVREALASALGRTGGTVGVGRLIELLKYPSSQATEHDAELGLQEADRDILMAALKPLLEGSDFRLKVSAARILSEKDRKAAQP